MKQSPEFNKLVGRLANAGYSKQAACLLADCSLGTLNKVAGCKFGVREVPGAWYKALEWVRGELMTELAGRFREELFTRVWRTRELDKEKLCTDYGILAATYEDWVSNIKTEHKVLSKVSALLVQIFKDHGTS